MEPAILVVMDGVGLRENPEGNAFKQADTPILDRLMREEGYTELRAFGPAVGLPESYQGNSEVGHLHLGAGRRVPQRLKRINESIETGEFEEKKALRKALERAESKGSTVHLAGIVSDGGIHGHLDHLEALMEAASGFDVDVKIHCFTDGRDVDPKSAGRFLSTVEDWTREHGGEIATVMGRFYSMDRDHNWGRTEKAYRAMALGEGFEFSDPEEALQKTYREGDYDYFVTPSVRQGYTGMKGEDELIFYNFRADREVQITKAFLQDDFAEFENPVRPVFTSMFRYEKDFENPVLFEKQVVEDTLGEKIEDAGLSQLRITESQKIPHVTYFFNGQREIEFEGEERRFVESDKIKAYDQKPEMHAEDITDVLVDAVEDEGFDFILINFPNGDLVGHTGDLGAAVKAVETVDRNLERILDAAERNGYTVVVTADHGNCEDMGSEDSPNTSHTLNRVPAIGVGFEPEFSERELWEVEKVLEDLLDL